jgi:hypothetical protein
MRLFEWSRSWILRIASAHYIGNVRVVEPMGLFLILELLAWITPSRGSQAGVNARCFRGHEEGLPRVGALSRRCEVDFPGPLGVSDKNVVLKRPRA